MLSKKLSRFFRYHDYDQVLFAAAQEFACPTRELREKYQREKFNRVWIDAYQNVPFYTKWKKEHNLPDSISSLDELAFWPIITKKELQKTPALMLREKQRPDKYGFTG